MLRNGKFYRWAHLIAPLAVLLLAVGLRRESGGLADEVKSRVFDQLQRWHPRAYQDAGVRIVDIDDESLARLGQWPWPRTLLARLIDAMAADGAAVAAFDAVFAEPDRTSPLLAAESWGDAAAVKSLRARLSELPDHDRLMARVMGRRPVVLAFSLTDRANDAVPAAKAHFSIGGDSPLPWVPDFPGAVTPLPALEGAAAGLGSMKLIPEPDGIVRRAQLLFRRGPALLPALSIEALRVAQGANAYAVKASAGRQVSEQEVLKSMAKGDSGASREQSVARLSHAENFGQHVGISKLKVGKIVIPTDPFGRFWVYFTPADAARTVPAWCVLDRKCAGDKLKDTIVFVGTSAEGLKDLRATPLNPAAPGVEVHANVVEQALTGAFLNRPDWAEGAELLYMLLLGLFLLFLLPRLGAAWCAAVAAAGIAGAFAFSWDAFTRHHLLIDPLFPGATVLLVYMSSSLISYLKSEAERGHIQDTFGKYLNPRIVEDLARHPEKVRLGGETRDMTILFCDIRGFTTISEQYDAQGLTRVINRFLTPMTGIIMDRLGYIDKYIGDCIMAFWNAPVDDAEHASNACRAALEMHKRLDALNADLEAEAKASGGKFIAIHIGVGLNTGPCCVGNMGADQKFNYSVLGDDVNLASRLEGQSKTYGAATVIGPRTKELAPDFAALELDLIRVKGKTRPVRIYSLLGDAAVKESPEFKALGAEHEKFLSAYRARDWDGAEGALGRLRGHAVFQLKVLYDLYEKRIAAYRAAPPAADWDGAYTATTK